MFGRRSTESDEVDGRIKLAYDESIRALDAQAKRLSDLSARTSQLLAASSLVAGFLASEAVKQRGNLGGFAIAGVIAFVCLAILVAWLMSPSSGWQFISSPKKLLEQHVEGRQTSSEEDMLHILAVQYDGWHDNNEKKLLRRQRVFQVGCLLLAVEVILLVTDLWRS